MAVAHWPGDDTLTQLEAGSAVPAATVWRYLRKAVNLLAVCADLAAATV